MSTPLVAVRGLTRRFDVSKPWLNRLLEGEEKRFLTAVGGVDFEIPARSTFALVGESGSGKSTIGRIAVGLLAPSGGSVEIGGVDLFRSRDREAVAKARGRIHRFRLLFLANTVATQGSTELEAPVEWQGGAGAGFSFVISGDRGNHFRTRLFLAWPLEPDPQPLFYWQTSLFSGVRRM